METPKLDFFFQKSSKFEFWLLTKSWNHLSFVNISPTLVIDTSMERSSRVLRHVNPKIGIFFQKNSKFEFWLLSKSWNHLSFVNISPTLLIDTSMERSSRVLHHVNPKMWKNFKKFEIDEIVFCPYPEFPYAKKKNRPGFVNISPTWVIDMSMERSSQVLQHGNQKIWFFFSKSSKSNSTCILTCVEELKSFKLVSTCTYMSTSGMHRRPLRVDI